MSRSKRWALRALVVCIAATFGRPALAAEGCSLKQAASLPMHIVHNEILVDVTIDDLPVSFIIDTGAGTSLIGRGLVERLKLPVKAQRGSMYGVAGGAQAYAAVVRTLQMGQMVAHNQPFFIEDNFGDGQDRRPAGIFGADLLGSYDFEIDFAAAKLNLYLRDHCPDRVVYWDDEYFKLPFSPGNGPTPRINISVSVDGHPLHGILDTGAYHTAIRLATARAKLNYDETTAGDPTLTFGGVASMAHRVGYKHHFLSWNLAQSHCATL